MKLQTKDYQLRYAAGKYWLLAMSQQGFAYRRPIALNESGARLWKLLAEGLDRREAAGRLAEEYGLAENEALRDVDSFIRQLEENTASD
jgi:pilus assembly protein TadC